MGYRMEDKDFYWDEENGFLSAYTDDDCCEPLKPKIIQKVDVDNNIFHIGQGYTDKPAVSVMCRKCGSIKFQVGVSDYFTAIKCVNCNWEMCIHDG